MTPLRFTLCTALAIKNNDQLTFFLLQIILPLRLRIIKNIDIFHFILNTLLKIDKIT